MAWVANRYALLRNAAEADGDIPRCSRKPVYFATREADRECRVDAVRFQRSLLVGWRGKTPLDRRSQRQDRVFASGEWRFPPGTVFVKSFDLPLDAAKPGTSAGSKRGFWCAMPGRSLWSGVQMASRWQRCGSIERSETENIPVKSASGEEHDRRGTTPAGRIA